ncbi:pyridoxamine 5'-phosphate oxidase family protein [Geobacter sp. DSM 9736]|uniref:pyridoxamine 5'-phosphate oxidase family protein n=1 Tax=Geobacter sp. DSM 9736 TaxID=1277350 RepID=UPI000B513E6C|nr:pyridoxamine 5'-phosphate oxidase family protein [Geobacter sp. DSM 9736]SNB46979.1 hypothetical protein SAMN06269301_2453 [Geobacter sp. DSM 9736]
MRKIKKRITDMAPILDLLNRCHVGHLGTIGRDGWPNIKPLNFAYQEWRIYVHCANDGEKLDEIRRDNRVCFEVDLPLAYVRGTGENPCRASYLYRSVIIRGRATIVTDPAERRRGLDCLMAKYQPEGSYGPYLEEKLELTTVVRIEIDEISGKEDLGKDQHKALIEAALTAGTTLPLVLD